MMSSPAEIRNWPQQSGPWWDDILHPMRKPLPVVRLQGRSLEPSHSKKNSGGSTAEVVKIAVRLIEPVNEALRTLIRYRGDLSKMALQALDSIDLKSVPLVSPENMTRDTTISMPPALHDKLKTLAGDRESSMNILVNTALAHWLAKRGNLKLI